MKNRGDVSLWVVLAVVLIILVSLIGCNSNANTDTGEPQTGNLTYFMDTGLCYASLNSITQYGYKVASITNVPCTPEVKAVLSK